MIATVSEALRRDYTLSAPLATGGTWTLSATIPDWQVRPAVVIVTLAFARPRSGQMLSLRSIALDSALVLSAVTHGRSSAMCWTPAYEKLSLGQKRLVAECLGLAVTIQHCKSQYKWTSFNDLHHIDNLAEGWKWLRPSRGPRPDIAYTVKVSTGTGARPSMYLRAAEAKGRNDYPPSGATPEQKALMEKLGRWSLAAAAGATGPGSRFVKASPALMGGKTGIAFSACWVWMKAGQANVDTFDPGEELPLSEDGLIDLQRLTDAMVDGATASLEGESVEEFAAVASSARGVFERVGDPGEGSVWVGVIGASEDLADVGDDDDAIVDAQAIFDSISNGSIRLIDASFGRRLVGLVMETDSQSLDIRAVERALANIYEVENHSS